MQLRRTNASGATAPPTRRPAPSRRAGSRAWHSPPATRRAAPAHPRSAATHPRAAPAELAGMLSTRTASPAASAITMEPDPHAGRLRHQSAAAPAWPKRCKHSWISRMKGGAPASPASATPSRHPGQRQTALVHARHRGGEPGPRHFQGTKADLGITADAGSSRGRPRPGPPDPARASGPHGRPARSQPVRPRAARATLGPGGTG